MPVPFRLRVPEFLDAQQMHVEHPDTFEAPSRAELDAIRPHDLVKVCVEAERFWVVVTQHNGESLAGTVDNMLLLTGLHGLAYSDAIQFETRHVLSIARR